MQIEVDLEKLVSRVIIDGILSPNNIQREVDSIIKSNEYKKIFSEQVKSRLNEILFSEEGKKQIDSSILNAIAASDLLESEIEKILEKDEYERILEKQIKDCLQEILFSEEGKEQILLKTKDFLENYEIEYDDDFSNELNKEISDVLLFMMKGSFKRIKMSIKE